MQRHEYIKLGAFIVIGTFMVVSLIVILGAGRYFQTTYQVESYFNESVNGLEIGSPVKLRGVRIGRVADINFVANRYENASLYEARQVLVVCDIYPDLFRDMSYEDFKRAIKLESERGLRVRPTSLGLTGQIFLNLQYLDPETNPPMDIQWEPDKAYIPSVPSTLNLLESAVTSISNTLSSVSQESIESIVDDFRSIMSTLETMINTEGGKEAASRIINILGEVDTMLVRINTIIADPELEKIIPEAAEAMTTLNTILKESSGDVIQAAAEANQAMTNIKKTTDVLGRTIADPRTDKALTEIAPMLENVAKASKDLSAAVSKIHNLANRMNSIVASEQGSIHAIMEDTREVMENLRELTGDAKRYPSGTLFGAPPTKPSPVTTNPNQ